MKRSWNLHSWFMDKTIEATALNCSVVPTFRLNTHRSNRVSTFVLIHFDFVWCAQAANTLAAVSSLCATRTNKSIETNSVPKMRECVMRVSVISFCVVWLKWLSNGFLTFWLETHKNQMKIIAVHILSTPKICYILIKFMHVNVFNSCGIIHRTNRDR